MSSKLLISSDSISWTLAKPAMLVVAAVGGISGHAGPERAPPASRPPAPAWAGAAHTASLGLAAPVVQPRAAAALAVPGIRRAALAAPQAQAPSAGFVQAFPEVAEMGATPAAAPTEEPAQFSLTTWGTLTPAIQQSLAPAFANAEAILDDPIAGGATADGAIAQGAGFAATPGDLKLPGPGSAAIAVAGVQFVAVPVVQPIPEAAKAPTAEAKSELILGAVQQAAPAPAAQEAPASKVALAVLPASIAPTTAMQVREKAKVPAPALASPGPAAPFKALAPAFARAPAVKPVASGKQVYALKDGIIEFALAARVNGAMAGPIGLRISPDDRLWLRLGDLIDLVRTKMAPADFARLSASARAADYVEFDTIRRAGIDLRYDAPRNQITVGAE